MSKHAQEKHPFAHTDLHVRAPVRPKEYPVRGPLSKPLTRDVLLFSVTHLSGTVSSRRHNRRLEASLLQDGA